MFLLHMGMLSKKLLKSMFSSPLAFNSNRLVQNSIWSKKARSIKGFFPTSGKCNLLLATNRPFSCLLSPCFMNFVTFQAPLFTECGTDKLDFCSLKISDTHTK